MSDLYSVPWKRSGANIQYPTGNVGINSPSPGAKFEVISDSASKVGAIIKAAASPSVDILRILSSTNQGFFSIRSDGAPNFNASGIRLFENGNLALRMLAKFGASWSDNAIDNSFFQFGDARAFFTGASGTVLTRFGISSNGTVISDFSYTILPIPNATLLVASNTASRITNIVRAAPSQSVDIAQWQDSAAAIIMALRNDNKLTFGPSGSQDTNIYRSAADTLKTDDSMVANNYATAISTKTTTYTITATDSTILANATTASFSVNLPTAVGISGRIYTIKKIDATGNIVTIDANGSETIDGQLTQSLDAQWETAVIQSNGTSWFIIGSY